MRYTQNSGGGKTLSPSERLTKRSTFNVTSTNQSLSNRSVSRKNSKFISSFTVDDFHGNRIVYDNAKDYHSILSGQELERLKTIESRDKIKNVIYLAVTITLNVMNLFACCTFIIEDYISYTNCTAEQAEEPGNDCTNVGLEAIDKLEVSFSIIFLIEVFYNFLQQTKPKYQFFVKKDTIVDMLTIVPPLLNLALESKIKIGFLRMLRMLKVMRVIRIFKMLRKSENKTNDSSGQDSKPSFQLSPIQNQVIILMLNIFTTVFIAAGIIMFIDNVVPSSFSADMRFVDAIYYMIITSGTIGYGDYFPINTISALAAIIKDADFYDTQYKIKGHIIVIGTQKISILTRFLLNFYKLQMSTNNPPQCIIIGETRISPKMKRILNFTIFEDKVYYLSVKSIDQQALKKGCFYDASAVFYLSDQFSSSPDASDKKALFINQFLMNNNIRCNMYIQLCITDQPSFVRMQKIENLVLNKSELEAMKVNAQQASQEIESKFEQRQAEIMHQQVQLNNQAERYQIQNIISINLIRTKFQILAFSLFNEGAIQLFSNWFLNDHELLDETSFQSNQKRDKFQTLIDTASIYQQQLDYKLYVIDFPTWFIGKSFAIALQMFNNINHCYQGGQIIKSILIGIKRCSFMPKNDIYTKKGQKMNADNISQNLKKFQDEYDSQWHLNQDLPKFNSGSKYYIINSPESIIQTTDQAILLSSCDDVTRFFGDADIQDLLQEYKNRNPVEEYLKKKKIQQVQEKRRNSVSVSRVTPKDNISSFKKSQIFGGIHKQQTTVFDTQPSHRLLMSDSGDRGINEENYASRQISIKANLENNLDVISSPIHNYQQRSTINRQDSEFKHSQNFHLKDDSSSLGSSSNEEFEEDDFSASDDQNHFNDRNNHRLRLRTSSQGSEFLQSKQQYKKEQYNQQLKEKLDKNKKEKCAQFLMKSLKHQLRKMFDYKCTFPEEDKEEDSKKDKDNEKIKLIDLSTTDVSIYFARHIIIYGGQKSGVEYFVEEIRKMSAVPLCIYSQDEEMEEQFNRMTAKFKNIYFFKGEILNIRHLQNANVKQSQTVVVLSERSDEQPFGDSQSIIVTQFIRGLYPQKRIITEVLDISRLALMEQPIQEQIRTEKNLTFSYFLSKELMSGRIFFSQQIDVLASLRSTEPHLPIVFLKMIGQETEIYNFNEELFEVKMDQKSKDQQQKAMKEDLNEKSNLLSLRVPKFMDGHHYWELFDDMQEHEGFILLGVYTQNFNTNEESENIRLFQEIKENFNNKFNYDEEEKDLRNETHILGKSKFFQNKSTAGSNGRKINDENDWFDIDPGAVCNNVPLLILNPPMGTRLRAGDTILAIGSFDNGFITQYLQQNIKIQ